MLELQVLFVELYTLALGRAVTGALRPVPVCNYVVVNRSEHQRHAEFYWKKSKDCKTVGESLVFFFPLPKCRIQTRMGYRISVQYVRVKV